MSEEKASSTLEHEMYKCVMKCMTSPIHQNGMYQSSSSSGTDEEEEDPVPSGHSGDKPLDPRYYVKNCKDQSSGTSEVEPFVVESPFVTAAKIGNIERLLRYKQSKDFPVTPADIDDAICESARNNHLHVLSWLTSNYGMCTDRAIPMVFAAVRGHVEIFEYLCSVGYEVNKFIMSYAAQYGRTEFMCIAKNHRYMDWAHTAYCAFKFEQLDSLRFCLREIIDQDSNNTLRSFLNYMIDSSSVV
jgi:hypothetical protein